MAGKDKELHAISSIIELLKPLDASQRSRVLDYVLNRLDMATVPAPTTDTAFPASASARPMSTGVGWSLVKDIRSFTAEKQPRSINDMVAVVAYYLAEMASDTERSHTINVDAVKKYFRMAGFPLPTQLKNALTNAAQAGYLENVGKGEYRLNPVGYNLVVHGLPKGGQESSSPRRTRRGPKRRKRSKN